VYELQDVVHWQNIREGVGHWYYHLNITVGAGSNAGGSDLFFAEVSRDREEDPGYFLTCFCRVQPDGDGILTKIMRFWPLT
jgi:hypothetical protein